MSEGASARGMQAHLRTDLNKMADEPDGLFVVEGALSLTSTPLQFTVPWIADLHGAVYSVVTSPMIYDDSAILDEMWLYGFSACIESCFANKEFVAAMRTRPVDLTRVFSDLVAAEFDAAIVNVSGVPVECVRTVYEGVEFAAGHDYAKWPFAVSRRAGQSGRWPELAKVIPEPQRRR